MESQQRTQAIATMLELQHSMNQKVHSDWIAQNFEWYRAIWIECGELMEHYGYKWWKKQTPDVEQVRLEVIDIWHFGLSALFKADFNAERDLQAMATEIESQLHAEASSDVRAATEALAEHSLRTKGFSVALFAELMQACDLSFESLYQHYVGKNVLNFFRQDHGYKDGTYRKLWQGREDNEHLMEIINASDCTGENFADELYQALSQRYQNTQ